MIGRHSSASNALSTHSGSVLKTCSSRSLLRGCPRSPDLATNHGGNEFNHWMSSAPAYGIWNTAVEFLSQHPSQVKIAINDMSLPYGGTFDINQNWQTPHVSHQAGKGVDVRGNGALYAIPDAQQAEFRQLCMDNGATQAITEFSGTSNQHVHCLWP